MTDYPTDPNCIFCKIIAGQIPCHKVYEDDDVLAFLDVGPLSDGHTLVIPKGHYATLAQVPPEVAAGIGRVLPALSQAIMQTTGATSWNVLQNNGEGAGQDVHHVHFHLIPRKRGSDRKQSTIGDGLAATSWLASEIDHGPAAKLADQIKTLVE